MERVWRGRGECGLKVMVSPCGLVGLVRLRARGLDVKGAGIIWLIATSRRVTGG